MSFKEASKVMAMLIRLPDHNRGEGLEELFNEYDLTEKEKSQLLALANNREVLKFGNKMRLGRITYLKNVIDTTLKFIPFEKFESLLKEHFDPYNTSVEFLELFEAYLRFFFKNKMAYNIISEDAPPFAMEIFKFELIQAIFEYGGFENRNNIPKNSPLTGMGHHLEKFEYKIVDFMETGKATEGFDYTKSSPEKKESFLIFVASTETDEGFRMFELDEEHFNFIRSLEEDNPNLDNLPKSYNDLADLGLVKKLP